LCHYAAFCPLWMLPLKMQMLVALYGCWQDLFTGTFIAITRSFKRLQHLTWSVSPLAGLMMCDLLREAAQCAAVWQWGRFLWMLPLKMQMLLWMDVDKVCSWFFSADRKIIQTSAASNISASPHRFDDASFVQGSCTMCHSTVWQWWRVQCFLLLEDLLRKNLLQFQLRIHQGAKQLSWNSNNNVCKTSVCVKSLCVPTLCRSKLVVNSHNGDSLWNVNVFACVRIERWNVHAWTFYFRGIW
jgi:hypothetical protein